MPTNLDVPSLGESISEAVLLKWNKNDGDAVAAGETVVELETDKANVDLQAPAAGVLRHAKQVGESVHIGETIARIDEAGAASPAVAGATPQAAPAKDTGRSAEMPPPPTGTAPRREPDPPPAPASARPENLSPGVRRMVAENRLDPSSVPSSGRGGRLTKEDVQKHLDSRQGAAAAKQAGAEDDDVNGEVEAAPAKPATPAPPGAPRAAPAEAVPAAAKQTPGATDFDASGVKRVPLSKMRKRIAENLVRAQQTAAILTTFNEVDLSRIMDLRARYKERFNEVHGVGLGLMSFFVRACVLGLREFPRINAFLEGDDVVYHNHVHMGIAVSTDRGLAVPVLRNVENMSFAKIESEIKRLATATRDGKLGIQELSGGTFTITNGGVFGSLLSTPILNPPQSGILGMHTIQKRPVAAGDKVEVHPMMYVALSYDHRLVDGRESVSFLVRVKELLEDPARLMLEV